MIRALLVLCLAAAPDAGPDAGPVSIEALEAEGIAAVERGDLEAARAAFAAVLEEDPDHELPADAPRRARGYFRLLRESVAPTPAPTKPAAPSRRPQGARPQGARPTPAPEVPPSVKPPSTLAIEDPDTLDYIWWTVAGVSAGAIVVTAVIVGFAVAADPAEPRGTLGRVELP